MDFYGAAAQVIPVLYLVMAFESRWLFRKPVRLADLDPSEWAAHQIMLAIFLALLTYASPTARCVVEQSVRFAPRRRCVV